MTEQAMTISGKKIDFSEISGEVFETSAGQFWLKTDDGHESVFKLPDDAPVPRANARRVGGLRGPREDERFGTTASW